MDGTEENGNNLQFDYSPWQRIEKKSSLPRNSLLNRPSTLLQPLGRKPTIYKTSFPISPRKSPSSTSQVSSAVVENLFPNLRKECSTLCHHGARIKTPEISLPEKRKSKDGNIALLKLLIKERRLALQGNKQRYMKLIGENLSLKEEISSFEEVNHNDVNGLLTKYKKYQGALAVLNHTHAWSLKEEEMELHKTQDKIDKMLIVLKNDSQVLDTKIEKEKHALKVLHNYKEKEYPDKLEQMKHLQYEIDTLEAEFVAAIQELQGIADVEQDKYIANAEVVQDDMISELADNTLVSMDSPVKEMARQNVLISQEIDFHKEEFERHQTEIHNLEVEIRMLKEREKTKCMRRRYPEQFLERCLPDTEFELRIPKQRYLPI